MIRSTVVSIKCRLIMCRFDHVSFDQGSVQFSRFLFPPLVEQNTYINVITLRKKGHATKRNNVETCKNSTTLAKVTACMVASPRKKYIYEYRK